MVHSTYLYGIPVIVLIHKYQLGGGSVAAGNIR